APSYIRYPGPSATAVARAVWTQISTPIFLCAPFMNPDTYCQEKAARSGSSFYYAFLFLPPERRKAITALYAFCREVDDIVDECREVSVARMKLAWWRTQIEQMYAGKAEHPVTQALTPHLESCQIKAEQLYAVIEGMEMDLDQIRYPDWNNLRKYCWHAAG